MVHPRHTPGGDDSATHDTACSGKCLPAGVVVVVVVVTTLLTGFGPEQPTLPPIECNSLFSAATSAAR
jgi:hypothetical protein